jgi:polyketide-type polyunsaturated fatty acid synthase PfaA
MIDQQNPCNIAIVGVSALFPGSTDNTGFWQDILAGTDLIQEVPPTHWLVEDYYDPDPSAVDKTYCKRGSFLGDVDFNTLEFALPPSNLSSTDTSQLLALIVANQVLHDAARGQFQQLDRERISIILGVASATELVSEMASRLQRPIWVKALRESGLPESEINAVCERISASYVPWQESTFPGLLGNVVAGRIANRLNLGGTNCVIDAACASSLSALSMSIMELVTGKSDMVITGGVDALNDIFMYMCFSKTPALSPTGDIRPFSDEADGTILGEGIGMVALKRLADAERDGDKIYAVIKGMGSSSDGHAKSVYAPVGEGQAKALRRAYEAAGYSPQTVELIEAHGTGTKAGDVAEFEGLKLAFMQEESVSEPWCAVGTVKSQIGHTKAAAGAAGLFKAVMALHHKILPPTIKIKRPNPKLGIEASPFYLNTMARPWIRDGLHPRRASVSSFGFGGSNFHVALEEYSGPGKTAERLRSFPAELLLFSADLPEELISECREAAELSPNGKAWVARARLSQKEFDPGKLLRLAVISTGSSDLSDKLRKVIEIIGKQGSFSIEGVHFANALPSYGRIALLFPGQGSQYVNMGADLAMGFDQARLVWDRSANITFDGTDTKLHRVVYPIPVFTDEERKAQTAILMQTEWAQPALGTASLAVLGVLRAVGIKADALGGHSFGELTALYAAGVIDETALVEIARKRGELMAQAASIPGAMSAVFRDKETVAELILINNLNVAIANYNSPEQLVVSGQTNEVERLELNLAEKKIRYQRLSVATAFHSSVVESSVTPFLESLLKYPFQKPDTHVFSNMTGELFSSDIEVIRETIAGQIAKPVLFEQQLQAMYEAGVRTFIEVGPGGVLTGLVEQSLKDPQITAVCMDRKGQHGVTMLWNALGKLAAAGLILDYEALWKEDAVEETEPEIKKKPGMIVQINGANYKKPYPPVGGAAALPKPNPEKVETIPALNIYSESLPKPQIQSAISLGGIPLKENVPAQSNHTNQSTQSTQLNQSGNRFMSQGSAEYITLLQTFQELQRQTADAHIAHQQSMAAGHAAFLRSAEATFTNLSRLISGESLASQQVSAAIEAPFYEQAPMQRPATEVPRHNAPIEWNKVNHMTVPPDLGRIAAVQPIIQPTLQSVTHSEVMQPKIVQSDKYRSSKLPPEIDLQQMLFQIVADKTGYPIEMLELEMDLESGLGIDSIKRVEILSSVQDRFPSATNLNPSEMAVLQSLGEIVAYMKEHDPNAASQSLIEAAKVKDSAPVAAKLDIAQLLLEIVSAKTGYPIEMLDLSMELESGLGIDSIKRVEILSSIQDLLPSDIIVNASEMAVLQTLGEIVAYMEDHTAKKH